MKKSSEIVKQALSSRSHAELPEGVRETDNGDGTVTLEFTIEIDPEVAKAKGAAMQKGQTREDMSDVMDPEEESVAEDAAPSQPSKSRHDTPLDNCRAIDPMFCPYHGQKAIASRLEDELKNIVTKGTPPSVVVEKTGSLQYKIAVTVDAQDVQSVWPAIDSFQKLKGFSLKSKTSIASGRGEVGGEYEINPSDAGIERNDQRVQMLNEWTDTLLDEYANDPNTNIDTDDLADLLQTQQDIDDLLAHPTGNKANDDKAFIGKCRDFEKKYHAIRAQSEMAHVNNNSDISTEVSRITNSVTKEDPVDVANEMKQVCAKLNIPPRTRAAAFPWDGRNVYSARYSSAYTAKMEYDRILTTELAHALASNDIKTIRTVLHNFDYAAIHYNDAMDKFKDAFADQMAKAKAHAAKVGIQL